MSTQDGLALFDHLTMLGKREGKPLFFRESRRLDGRSAAADRNDDGSFSYAVSGSSPQGEEQSLNACRLLIKKLNSQGAKWGEPSFVGAGHVDCQAFDITDHENVLQVQVVQAVTDKRLWKRLNAQGSVQVSATDSSAMTQQIEAAIKHKEVIISVNARSDLVLLLDATLVPVLSFDHVIEEFRSQFGTWVDSLGFAAIWLVGPLDD